MIFYYTISAFFKAAITMLKLVLALIVILVYSCSKISTTLPKASFDNGGLFLPDNFEALVVVDSIGKARHLAVNNNGDIYVKLTYNRAMKGSGGSTLIKNSSIISSFCILRILALTAPPDSAKSFRRIK